MPSPPTSFRRHSGASATSGRRHSAGSAAGAPHTPTHDSKPGSRRQSRAQGAADDLPPSGPGRRDSKTGPFTASPSLSPTGTPHTGGASATGTDARLTARARKKQRTHPAHVRLVDEPGIVLIVPPRQVSQHPSPDAAAAVAAVHATAGLRHGLATQSAAASSAPSASAANAQLPPRGSDWLFLCPHFRAQMVPQGATACTQEAGGQPTEDPAAQVLEVVAPCPNGEQCGYVHACASGGVRHVAHAWCDAWSSLDDVAYPRLGSAERLHVAPPNGRDAVEMIDPSLCLRTNAMSSERRPLSHCAHFTSKGVCDLGEDCLFVHFVGKLQEGASTRSEGSTVKTSAALGEDSRGAWSHIGAPSAAPGAAPPDPATAAFPPGLVTPDPGFGSPSFDGFDFFAGADGAKAAAGSSVIQLPAPMANPERRASVPNSTFTTVERPLLRRGSHAQGTPDATLSPFATTPIPFVGTAPDGQPMLLATAPPPGVMPVGGAPPPPPQPHPQPPQPQLVMIQTPQGPQVVALTPVVSHQMSPGGAMGSPAAVSGAPSPQEVPAGLASAAYMPSSATNTLSPAPNAAAAGGVLPLVPPSAASGPAPSPFFAAPRPTAPAAAFGQPSPAVGASNASPSGSSLPLAGGVFSSAGLPVNVSGCTSPAHGGAHRATLGTTEVELVSGVHLGVPPTSSTSAAHTS